MIVENMANREFKDLKDGHYIGRSDREIERNIYRIERGEIRYLFLSLNDVYKNLDHLATTEFRLMTHEVKVMRELREIRDVSMTFLLTQCDLRNL
jgi:hypothetical protein